MLELLMVPGCRVGRLQRDGGSLIVPARGRRDAARCPDCHCPSGAVHGHYRRRPADLPLCGHQVRLDLRLRRYACTNEACRLRTFAKRLPALVAPRSRRTRRLARAQAQVGVALGGEPGSRLAHRLGLPASGDTLLRLVRAAPAPGTDPPAIIGVDDWAMRRRKRYGTIIVDLERRRPVDLLPDRTAGTLAGWLRSGPGISLVARDRSTEYRRAITDSAPTAVQVANRWHLLVNARQMVERWAAGAHARLRGLPPVAVAEPPVGRAKAFVRTRSAAAVAADSRTRRKARYEDVRRRFLAGESLRAIGKATRLARATVRKHAHAAVFPERAARAPVPSIIDPHLPHLQARLAEGCRNAAQLWRECRERGFAGTPKQIRRWLQDRRTVFHQHTPYRWRDVVPPAAAAPPVSAGPPLPTPKRLAWIIAKDPGTRSTEEAAAIARVEQDAAAATLVRLVGRFAGSRPVTYTVHKIVAQDNHTSRLGSGSL